MTGESSIGEEAALAVSITLDLYSTEDHGHHLRYEAVCRLGFTVRLNNTPVKRENGKPVAGQGFPASKRSSLDS
jgi:hypothetical protein